MYFLSCWNNYYLIKKRKKNPSTSFFRPVSRISTEKCKTILASSAAVSVRQLLHRVSRQRTRREVITGLPFTCNLQQMHITLSVWRSINWRRTITIYQQGGQVEQIPRLELVMMSSNTSNRSLKSAVLLYACVMES